MQNQGRFAKGIVSLMTRGMAVVWLGGMLGLTGLGQEEEEVNRTGKGVLKDRADYQSALRASSLGLHEVAALKYERIARDKDLPKEEAALLVERLVDALIRANQAQKALVVLGSAEVPEAAFYRAQALLKLKRYRDAAKDLERYLEAGGKHKSLARLALGQALIAQGRETSGRNEWKELLTSPETEVARRAWLWWQESEVLSGRSPMVLKRLDQERDDYEVEFLRACAWLQMKQGKRAEVILRNIANAGVGVGIDRRLRDAAQVRLAEAYVMQDRLKRAEDALVDLINREVESDLYEQAFGLLDSVRPANSDAVVRWYRQWAERPLPGARHALALYYLGREEMVRQRHEQAVDWFEKFLQLYPMHDRSNEVLRLLMALHGMRREDARVLELANEWRRRYGRGGEDTIDFLTGMVRFSRHEFADAGALFERAARTAQETLVKKLALYNMAVCALMGGQEAVVARCMAELKAPELQKEETSSVAARQVAADQAARLLLEKGLHLALERDVQAEPALQEFIKQYPQHPRVVEAHLALAEFCLLSAPPRARTARTALEAAQRVEGATEKMKEALDYAQVWLEEAEGDLAGVTAAGQAYLTKWEKSARRDEVRMKVAQAYYRLEDYPNAEAQFEQISEDSPNSPYAEVGLFFAGKSAMHLPSDGVERALTLWAEVIARGGPLARQAQRQQALAKRRQGEEEQALAVIESLLGASEMPEEERFSLLLEKGELLELMGRQNPKQMEEAIKVFNELTRNEKGTRAMRSRAGVALASCYRQTGRNSEALEVCFDVVERCLASAPQEPLNPVEYQWYYRAGFAALDLIEARQEWQAAANFAERLAQAGGARAGEAKQRASQLRLEHFIWDEK